YRAGGRRDWRVVSTGVALSPAPVRGWPRGVAPLLLKQSALPPPSAHDPDRIPLALAPLDADGPKDLGECPALAPPERPELERRVRHLRGVAVLPVLSEPAARCHVEAQRVGRLHAERLGQRSDQLVVGRARLPPDPGHLMSSGSRGSRGAKRRPKGPSGRFSWSGSRGASSASSGPLSQPGRLFGRGRGLVIGRPLGC